MSMTPANMDTPNRGPFGIQDQQTATNQQGVPVTYFAGTRKIAATWLSPVYNLKAVLAPSTGKKGGANGKGSKSSGGNTNPANYDYYGTVAGGLCVGESYAITSIISQGAEIWPIGKAWAVSVGALVGDLFVYDAQTYICQTSHTTSNDKAPPNATYWSLYVFTRGGGPYDDISVQENLPGKSTANLGTFRIYWGTSAQTVDPHLQAAGNDYGHDHPNYQGMTYFVIIDFLLGQGTQTAPNIEVVLQRLPTQSVITGVSAGLRDGQANLAAVAMEVLTEQNMLGQAVTLIDSASWQTVADLMDNQNALMACSPLMAELGSIHEFFDRLRELSDNFVRFDCISQTIETGLYRHGQAPAGGTYVTLTEADLTERPKLAGGAWTEVKSRSMVRYSDRVISYSDCSVKADDPRAYAVIQEHRTDNIDRPWITRMSQAMMHGAESLRTTGRPIIQAEIAVRRERGRVIKAGDYILLDVDLEPGSLSITEFFRVESRTIPMTGPIRLSIIADNTLSPLPYQKDGTPKLARQVVALPITNFRFFEGTFGLTGENGAVLVLAQRPNLLTTGFHLYFDTSSGGTFAAALGGQTNFACQATLTGAVAAGDSTVAINVAAQPDSMWATLQPGDLAAADDELLAVIVSVVPSGTYAGQVAEDSNGYSLVEYCSISASTLTSAGNYTLTVLRGRMNTQPLAFTTAHSEVWIIPKASLVPFNHAQFATLRANRVAGLTPDHGYLRMTTFTFSGELLLSDATSEYFRFPLKSPSAPNLVLTAPTSLSLTLTSPTFPYALNVAGTWSSADADLVDYQILCQKDTDTAPRLIKEQVFTNSPAASFDQTIFLEAAGTYIITLRAYNATGLTTEVEIDVGVTGSGAKVMPPVISFRGVVLTANEYGYFGRLDAVTQTPGAQVHWQKRYTLDQPGTVWSAWSATVDYPGAPAVHIPQYVQLVQDLAFGLTSGSLSVSGSLSTIGSLTVSGTTSGSLTVSGSTAGNLSVSAFDNVTFASVTGNTSGSLTISGTATGSQTFSGTTSGSLTTGGSLTTSGTLGVTGQITSAWPCTFVEFKFWATCAGMTDSAAVTVTFQDGTYV